MVQKGTPMRPPRAKSSRKRRGGRKAANAASAPASPALRKEEVVKAPEGDDSQREPDRKLGRRVLHKSMSFIEGSRAREKYSRSSGASRLPRRPQTMVSMQDMLVNPSAAALEFLDQDRVRPVSCRNPREMQRWRETLVYDEDEDLPGIDNTSCGIAPATPPKISNEHQLLDGEGEGEGEEKGSGVKMKSGASTTTSASTFWTFLNMELRIREKPVATDYAVQSQRVLNFLRLVYYLERMIFFGVAVCFDQFLLVFTLLPLRAVFGFFSSSRRLTVRTEHLRDMCNLILLAIVFLGLRFVKVGALYHGVRAQSFMKLYVLYNMLSLFARLFYSLGEDLLDSLYGCCASAKMDYFRFVITFAANAVYMFLHSVFMFVQIMTLNVAINSNDKTLLIILISSQFVELKSSCFKKFGHKNLFQLACSDVVERFELLIFMIVLILVNMAEIGIGTQASLQWMQRACYVGCALILSECTVDWLKHGFIIKFNMIDPKIYEVYRLILCGDVVKEARPSSSIPSLRTTLRRFGFIPIPLAGLLFRVIWDTLATVRMEARVSLIVATVLNMMALKLLVRIYVLGHAAKHVFATQSEEAAEPAPTLQPQSYAILTPASRTVGRGGVKASASSQGAAVATTPSSKSMKASAKGDRAAGGRADDDKMVFVFDPDATPKHTPMPVPCVQRRLRPIDDDDSRIKPHLSSTRDKVKNSSTSQPEEKKLHRRNTKGGRRLGKKTSCGGGGEKNINDGAADKASVGCISGDIAEKYTSIFPEKYRPIDSVEKLAGVSRYVLLESRVP